MAKAFVLTGGVKVHTSFAAAVLATSLLLDPGMASALTINETSAGSGIATDIEDLLVGVTLYDVVFRETATPQFVYGGTFVIDNETDASAAADAINTALEDAGINSVGPSVSDNDVEYYIGFDQILAADYRTVKSINNDPWTNEGTNLVGQFFNATYADFTVVPEPSTAVLTALGLIGLAARRRT